MHQARGAQPPPQADVAALLLIQENWSMNNGKTVAGSTRRKAQWRIWAARVLVMLLGCGPAAMAAASPSPAHTTPQSAWVRIMQIPSTRDVNIMKCDVSGNSVDGDVWKQPFACVGYGGDPIGTYKDRMYFGDISRAGSVGYCNMRTHACKNVPYVAFNYNLKGPNTVNHAGVIRGVVYVSGNNYAAQHHYPGYTLRSPGLIWLSKHAGNFQADPNGKMSFLTFDNTSDHLLLHICSAQVEDCRIIPIPKETSYTWGPHGHLYLLNGGAKNINVWESSASGQLRKVFSVIIPDYEPPFVKLPGAKFLIGDKVYGQNGKVLLSIPPIPGINANDYGLWYSNGVLYAIVGNDHYIIYRYNRPL